MGKHRLLILLTNVMAAVIAAPVGDIVITVIDEDPKPISQSPEPGVILIGDIQIDPDRNAVLNQHRWPGGVIPYIIDGAFPSDVQNKIVTAMREIENDVNPPSGPTCIKFVPRATQTNYVKVYRGTGCHSTVGMANKGEQTVSLGTGCDAKGIMMHELIHAIGFWHEQSRSDRNNYVNINLTNVIADDLHDFNLLSTSTSNNLNVPYDFGSVMHYGPYDFAINKRYPTMSPKPGQDHGFKMGQRLALSKSDALKIQRLYGCTEDTSHVTTPLAAGNVMAECDFESDLCTLRNDNTANFQWARRNGNSENGPADGNTNGQDTYLIATASGHNGNVARLITPTFNKGPVCVNFFMFQPDSSFLNIVLLGPNLPSQTIKTYNGNKRTSWYHSMTTVTVPDNAAYQFIFEAHMSVGDVAIDDVNIYHGACQ